MAFYNRQQQAQNGPTQAFWQIQNKNLSTQTSRWRSKINFQSLKSYYFRLWNLFRRTKQKLGAPDTGPNLPSIKKSVDVFVYAPKPKQAFLT